MKVMRHRCVARVFVLLALSLPAHSAVTALEIRQVGPAFAGRTFGSVGAYERVEAVAHFNVNPDLPINAGIVNLRKAPRQSDGTVAFDVDVVILRPADPAQASGRLVYEMVNRGTSLVLGMLNAGSGRDLTRAEAAGDGFLMNRGDTVVASGWQVDYPVADAPAMSVAFASRLPVGSAGLRARLPIATHADGSPIVGITREQLSDTGNGRSFIGYLTYPAVDKTQQATLTVRERDEDPRTTPPGLTWRIVDPWRVEITKPEANPPTQGAIYEFIYSARDPIVYGLGLVSMRDIVSWLRYDGSAANPLAHGGASSIRTVIGFGASQTGRTLKELVYEFNEDERGRMVFDGAHINISGAGKNAVNSEFARPGQKDAQHGPSRLRGDEFPFTYAVSYDPLSRRTDGVLARCQGSGKCPKIIHVDSENELWHGGALTYVDAARHDVSIPSNVRIYAFAGTEHSAAATTAPPNCQNRTAASIDWSTMNRALFVALEQWVVAGKQPPASHYPTLARNELAASDQQSNGFPRIPGITYSGAVDARFLLDFSVEPPAALAPYPLLAPRVDADGIMLGGVHHPYVSAPLATHTGWNLRRPGFGEGELCMASGMSIPFAVDRAARDQTGDPRLSIAERYKSAAQYVTVVAAAAKKLVGERLLLADDATQIVAAAGERYRRATGANKAIEKVNGE